MYQDWYTGITQTEEAQYTKQVGSIPPLPEIKKLCEGWITQQKSALKAKLCEPYCQKRQQFQNQEALLIAAVADALSIILVGIPINVVAVAVILVTEKHLDQFCDCSQ